ncbi:MAG: hypothetical protein AAB225_19315 [Acidobacteriota bacterium]
MKPSLVLLLISTAIAPAQRHTYIADPTAARAFKNKYIAMTNAWVDGIEFTPAELAAMRDGKKWEALMWDGPDDPLANKILAAGEPSYDAMAALYPGKILDRTVLGTWSDPRAPLGEYVDEFAIYWNGAIGANLIRGRLTDRLGATGEQPLAPNTVVLFRAGPNAEIFGRVRKDYSSIGYEQGYLPIVVATYETGGVLYRETALADKPAGETGGWDIAYVRFEMTNISKSARTAELRAEVILNDGGQTRTEGARVLDPGGAVLMVANESRRKFELKPGESAQLYFKIPYVPDAKPLVAAPSKTDFEAAHARVRAFWSGLLARAASIDVPEPRLNNVWRALLLQNFVLQDGPRFTYGSGLWYNDSTYPQEMGFGAHTFALYGFKDHANALQPWFVGMSVTRAGAGRKYQNRRAMVLHHLLETWRLTGKTDLFDRFKNDYYRIAEEIILDRRSTMVEVNGERPLHWGLLPPDKPGADVQASTQTGYVLGHNITNCQGLADFGRFLTVTGIDRERGERYAREAAEFRKTLLSAMERAAIRLPGRPPFVDLQTLYFRQTPDYGPEPYDDLAMGRLQGSYFHYWVDMEFHYNFFNPDDAVGQWLADYVQQRNGFVLGLTRGRGIEDKPSGAVNPVYDGGYYNYRLRRGEIDRFLIGLYGRLAFGMSRCVYVSSEGQPFIGYNTEKGGLVGAAWSFPNAASNADTLLMLRNALVLEELNDGFETGDIFLLRGAPRAWFQDGKRIAAAGLATYFGDISFSVDSRLKQRMIAARIDAPAQRPFRRLLLNLRHPERAPIRRVLVNGKEHPDCDLHNGIVRLAAGARSYSVEAQY